MSKTVIGMILGGGQGTRLFPLTELRSKPAVPLAGNYRLIDVPISNCLNSGIHRIYLLTQFNSVSLHRHVRQTYAFDRFGGGFVEILAAQQTMDGGRWYQGTADAVRQQLRYLQQPGIEHVLILSGDQLYRMDFQDMLATHIKANADATIAALPVNDADASSLGVMRFDDSGRVQGFLEKPQTQPEKDMMRTDPAWIDARGIPSNGRSLVASMGIYLFKRDTLVELLDGSPYKDFGKEVFPMSIRARSVHVHLFDGYWEDIGTIRAFFEANLALANPNPPFELTNEASPIFTRARSLPPTRLGSVQLKDSIISDGGQIQDGTLIDNCVIGVRCRIGAKVTLRRVILMGADLFERRSPEGSRPTLGIGDGTFIENAIVDKNCRIGKNVRITLKPGMEPNGEITINADHKLFVRDGIIVVPKECVVPDGWSVG